MYVSVPVPVPDEPVSHAAFELEVHAQPAVAVMVLLPLPAAAEGFAELTASEYEHEAAACVTRRVWNCVPLPTVMLADRAPPALAWTV